MELQVGYESYVEYKQVEVRVEERAYGRLKCWCSLGLTVVGVNC